MAALQDAVLTRSNRRGRRIFGQQFGQGHAAQPQPEPAQTFAPAQSVPRILARA